MPPAYKAQTIAAQALSNHNSSAHAIIQPVDVTTTYQRDTDNAYSSGYSYGRDDNATIRQCEDVLAQLENGTSALLFGSGTAAATAAFLALPRPAHIIAPKVMYWALRHWLAGNASAYGIDVSFVDMTDLNAIRAALRPGETKMIWIETPSNPTWDIVDIAACATIAHEAGAFLGADSTVSTPVLTRPIELGADVVMHSATKYLNGHSDVVSGALIFARDNEYSNDARNLRKSLGAILSPRDGALLLRGLRTLHLRVAHQCKSAMTIANHFTNHSALRHVLYPGLEEHPGHDVARCQMSGGFGGMLSIRIKSGEAAAIKTAAHVKLWRRATSLGGVESLIEHRASIEGEGTPCPADLLRLSVGIEDTSDLIEDLETALSFASKA